MLNYNSTCPIIATQCVLVPKRSSPPDELDEQGKPQKFNRL